MSPSDDRVEIQARTGLEAQHGLNDIFPGDLVSVSLGTLADEAARAALASLQHDLAAGCLAAFRAGQDFMVGPIRAADEDAFSTRPLHEPHHMSVTVRAGPVEAGSMDGGVPQGWSLYRVRDWQQ